MEELKTDVGRSWIQGRNGLYPITAVVLTPMQKGEVVKIDGMGKRGRIINGGLQITVKGMDDVCRAWQSYRTAIATGKPPDWTPCTSAPQTKTASRVVVHVRGGTVQGIYTDAKENLEVCLYDFDERDKDPKVEKTKEDELQKIIDEVEVRPIL